MKASDVMTTAVVSIGADGTVEDAVRLMLAHHVSALPVTGERGELVGLISEGDLLRRLQDKGARRRSWWLELVSGGGNAAEFVKVRSHRIADVMTRKLVTVREDTEVAEIARLLEKHRVKRVPVLRGGKVVGIVSRANLVQVLSRIEDGKLPRPTPTDEALRGAVGDALAEVPGTSINLVNVTVEDGIVTLSGVVDSDTVEKALRVAAENVPGVREVRLSLGRLPAWTYGI